MNSFELDDACRKALAKHGLPKQTKDNTMSRYTEDREDLTGWMYAIAGTSFIAGLAVACLVARIGGVL